MSHLFLTGFMGAGKSTVGARVAQRLSMPFLDLDAEIERREGASVRELFRSHGEPGFRDAEHAALAALATAPAAVIATGGGVVLREDNQLLLKELGTVVYLSVTPEEAMARLGDAGDRPLLAGGGIEAARSVLSARLALYARTADIVVDTVGRTAEQAAEAVVEALGVRAHPGPIRVEGAGSGYDVLVQGGLLGEAGPLIARATGASRVMIVSDRTVWAVAGSRLADALGRAGIAASSYVVEPGEPSKSWQVAGEVLEACAQAGLDRTSAIVALGGGVVGDVAGFCASTYMRGIALVHVPTTLLAQVDSAIGGKTGVDLVAGKNLAGTFWPPRLVLSDTSLLDTLPTTEWTNGLVEMIKAALLEGGESLDRFEQQLDLVLGRDPAAVTAAIIDAASFKARVVSADLRESDLRECLNLGHTLGHAIETLVGYGEISHGLAVAEGMRFAAQLADHLTLAAEGVAERTGHLLERCGAGRVACAAVLRAHASVLDPARVLEAMRRDKKSRAGRVRFVLVERPGVWEAREVDDDTLSIALGAWHAGLMGD